MTRKKPSKSITLLIFSTNMNKVQQHPKKKVTTVFPHMLSTEIIQERKLFKGRNYMRKYGIQSFICILQT